MALLYIISGETAKARPHLDIASSIDPLFSETLFYKAYYQYRTGKYNEALGMFDACLENR